MNLIETVLSAGDSGVAQQLSSQFRLDATNFAGAACSRFQMQE